MGRWVQYDVCVGGFVVDRCVRGGGSVGFRGGGWGWAWLIFFFFFFVVGCGCGGGDCGCVYGCV